MKTVKIATATIGVVLIASLAACSPAAEAETGTPQACLDALDYAEEVDGYMVDGLDASQRAMKAAVVWDSEGINAETEYIESITPDAQAARASYEASAAECRGM